MCELIISTKPAAIPIFVARDLTRIPMTVDYYEATSITKDIDEMKRNIQGLFDMQKSFSLAGTRPKQDLVQ